MKPLSRRAAQRLDQREERLEVLADYANMGDSPGEGRKFRSDHPKFFPDAFLGEDLSGNLTFTTLYELFAPRKLIWWRDVVRNFWINDKTSMDHLFGRAVSDEKMQLLLEVLRVLYHEIPSLTVNGHEIEVVVLHWGLPQIKLAIDEVSHKLRLEFGCELQQAFYLLMKKPWRKKICKMCGRYFIADRPTRRYHSEKCAAEAKCKRQDADWQTRGSNRRREVRKIERDRKSDLQAGA
jgi:hypothetical protein